MANIPALTPIPPAPMIELQAVQRAPLPPIELQEVYGVPPAPRFKNPVLTNDVEFIEVTEEDSHLFAIKASFKQLEVLPSPPPEVSMLEAIDILTKTKDPVPPPLTPLTIEETPPPGFMELGAWGKPNCDLPEFVRNSIRSGDIGEFRDCKMRTFGLDERLLTNFPPYSKEFMTSVNPDFLCGGLDKTRNTSYDMITMLRDAVIPHGDYNLCQLDSLSPDFFNKDKRIYTNSMRMCLGETETSTFVSRMDKNILNRIHKVIPEKHNIYKNLDPHITPTNFILINIYRDKSLQATCLTFILAGDRKQATLYLSRFFGYCAHIWIFDYFTYKNSVAILPIGKTLPRYLFARTLLSYFSIELELTMGIKLIINLDGVIHKISFARSHELTRFIIDALSRDSSYLSCLPKPLKLDLEEVPRSTLFQALLGLHNAMQTMTGFERFPKAMKDVPDIFKYLKTIDHHISDEISCFRYETLPKEIHKITQFDKADTIYEHRDKIVFY